MILLLFKSKIALEIEDNSFEENTLFVVKLKNSYFLGMPIKYNLQNNIPRKIIKLKKVNIVDKLKINNLNLITKTFLRLIKYFNDEKAMIRYLYLGLEKIILTLVKFEQILKIETSGIINVSENDKIKDNRKSKIKLVEHNYLENKTTIKILVKSISKQNLKKIKRKLEKKINKKRIIKYQIDYYFELGNQILFDLINLMKKNQKLLIVNDLEKIEREKIEENCLDKSGKIWKENDIIDLGNDFFVFPMFGIILSEFFSEIIITNYSKQVIKLIKIPLKSKIIVDPNNKLLSLLFKDRIEKCDKEFLINSFEIIKSKLIFDNFTLNELKEYLYSNRKSKLVIFSFFDSFQKFYCDYCGNIPYCEMCNEKLKVDKKSKEGKIRLVCHKCKVKYDTFNCQYCGKYRWRLWVRNYKEEFKDFEKIFIGNNDAKFVPTNFSCFVPKNEKIIFIIDYFSLYKPFIIKELNIWYILLKIVNETKVENILFMNAEEFNVFDYFKNFIYSPDEVSKRIEELIELERRIRLVKN